MSRSVPADGRPARERAVDVTRHFIRSKNPCAEGFRWYVRNHAPGNDYQHLLDSLVEAGRVDDACWLLDQLGPTHTRLEVDFLSAEAIVFAGTLVAARGIDVGGLVRAGGSIRSGGSVVAGGAIVAGDEVRAAGAIRTPGRLQAGGDVQAGWGVETGGPLRCGGNLRASGAVTAGEGLEVQGDVVVRGELQVQGAISAGKGVKATGGIAASAGMRVAQGVECNGAVQVGGHLDAGFGIKSVGSIRAGGAIRAGESICTEGELRAGTGYGVHAGLAVAVDDWACSAVVQARARPEHLFSGCWRGPVEAVGAPSRAPWVAEEA